MEKVKEFFEKSTRINLLLFLCSFGIYFLYFHSIFLNINSILSSVSSDSLKNYYTFVYHIKNDPDILNFSGMNYPYGEHIIYTDCQPILTFILRALPFTHNYLVGIMHSLIFFSFIVSPLILSKIFQILGIDKFFAFFSSLAIALLAPQFLKINAGHFALAYACVIPLSILFTLNYLNDKRTKHFLTLFIFNTLLFLLHPYIGFCLSLFSFISLFSFELISFKKKVFLVNTLKISCAGILPLLLFKIFMLITDHHLNRTSEPFGAEVMVENLDSILSPEFGPFQKLMETFFSNRTGHYEGHTYLGFFTLLLFLAFVVLSAFQFRKIQIKKEILVLLFSSFIFLLFAFGIHLKVLDYFHLKSPALNQFRAVCRFAWIFYYTLPVFLISVLYSTFKSSLNSLKFNKLSMLVALVFFSFNLLEANSFLTHQNSVFWKFRNFFLESQLNSEEVKVLADIRVKKPQAIIPLPLFHGGSEMYERPGSNNSMLPSMIYSYHSATPILSVLMSRTSLTETENMIQLLNSYKKEKAIEKSLGTTDFFVITTHDPLLPDESRLVKHVTQVYSNDSLQFGYISKKELLTKKISKSVYSLDSKIKQDTANIVYIKMENHKPFLEANIKDYENIFVLDSTKVSSRNYIVSFHYHYTQNVYRALGCNLIVNQFNKVNSEWIYNIPVRILSGFYDGFGVFEYRIALKKGYNYEFMLKGFVDQSYSISDFMLRPEETDVLLLDSGREKSYNNFPE